MIASRPGTNRPLLTEQQLLIIERMATGALAKTAAYDLRMKEGTVHSHLRNARKRLRDADPADRNAALAALSPEARAYLGRHANLQPVDLSGANPHGPVQRDTEADVSMRLQDSAAIPFGRDASLLGPVVAPQPAGEQRNDLNATQIGLRITAIALMTVTIVIASGGASEFIDRIFARYFLNTFW